MTKIDTAMLNDINAAIDKNFPAAVGTGIMKSSRVVCSCGYKSPAVTVYSSFYHTNLHEFRAEHLRKASLENKRNTFEHQYSGDVLDNP